MTDAARAKPQGATDAGRAGDVRGGVFVPENERLSLSVIWAYSLPQIAFGFMGMLFGMYLMKYATDVLLIAPAAMGTIFGISRLWDGVSDPVAGYLSDRTKSRLGRRRSWMYYSALPVGAAVFMLWSPPSAFTGTMLVVWVAFSLLVYETASTAYFVPHGALGLELTPNYHERTRLFGIRQMIGFAGTLSGLIALWFMTEAEDKRAMAFYLSLVGGSLIAIVIFWTTARLKERSDYQGRGADKIWKSFGDIFRNPHARLLLIVFGVETFGASSIGMLVPYVTEYILHDPGKMVPIMVVYAIPMAVFVPMWIRLSRRFGKKPLWVFSMALTTVAFFGLFFVDEGDQVLIWALPFVLGFAGGCGAVVAPSIKADVVDYDEYLTGERKEGSYLAIWNFVRKAAAAATGMATGFVLQASGFEPNVEQGEAALFAIRGLFSLLPASCYVIGTLLFLRFAFNEREHAEVRRVLDARAAGESEAT